MDVARTIHTLSARGRASLRDDDLLWLAERHPDLSAVFEEVQFLRSENEKLAERVDDLEDDVERLRWENENAE